MTIDRAAMFAALDSIDEGIAAFRRAIGKFQCACGESFDADVWHCPICAHHWPLHREECWNCNQGKRPAAVTA